MSRAEGAQWKTWDAPAEGVSFKRWHAGRCAWCGYEDDRLVKDHCHDTGLVRGFLCSGCNSHEGFGHEMYDQWRNGDHTAAAFGHFEIYTNIYGSPVFGVHSPANYYTTDEMVAFWVEARESITSKSGFPHELPWIETAKAKHEAEIAEMRELMSNARWSA